MWTRWGFSAGGWCRFFFSFSIKIIPADKGRTSVVLDTDTNQTKMTFLIENRPYQHLNKVPRNRRTRKLPEGLLTLNRSRHVSKIVYYKIRPRHKQPPRIYGYQSFIKPLKPIVSYVNNFAYDLRAYLDNSVSPRTGNSAHSTNQKQKWKQLGGFLRRFWTVSSVLLWVLIVFQRYFSLF